MSEIFNCSRGGFFSVSLARSFSATLVGRGFLTAHLARLHCCTLAQRFLCLAHQISPFAAEIEREYLRHLVEQHPLLGAESVAGRELHPQAAQRMAGDLDGRAQLRPGLAWSGLRSAEGTRHFPPVNGKEHARALIAPALAKQLEDAHQRGRRAWRRLVGRDQVLDLGNDVSRRTVASQGCAWRAELGG